MRQIVHDGHASHEGHGHEAHDHPHPGAETASVVRLHVDRPLLTPADVRNKVFATVRVREGYEMAQVDTFLDQVEATVSRVLQENAELRARPQAGFSAGESAPYIVALAQEAADRAIAMAQEEARKIVTEARDRAEATQREALNYGGRIREGLQSQIRQLRVLLSDLEAETTRITGLGSPAGESAADAGRNDVSSGATRTRRTTA
ncbi:MAG TPA: DivIVA domain-containing protein [Actinoallomurus sp.]